MDVVVVGSCMSDHTCYAPRLPQSGETIHGTKFQQSFGGKGANQCIMAAKLGAKTAMIAKVGCDAAGDLQLDNFRVNGVCCEHVTKTTNQPTGVAQICVDNSGANTIVIVAGANLCLTAEDVVQADSLIASASVVLCQFEVSPMATRAALQLARKHGATTVLNAAPALEVIEPYLYQLVDILCVNETEAGVLLSEPALNSVADALRASSLLLSRGCRTAIITLGADGAVLADSSIAQPVHIPVQEPTSPVVDTTGAGDAFLGALAYYLSRARHLPLIEMVERACCVAAATVTKAGAQTSYPSRQQLPGSLFNL